MPPFKFRIRFMLPTDIRIISPAERLTFNLPRGVGEVEFIGRSPDKKIESALELIIRSTGLATYEEAQQAGEKVRAALLLAAAELGIGVDLGREAPRSFLTEHGRRWIAEQTRYEGQLLNDQLGLVVYDDPTGTRFVQFGANAVLGKSLDGFREALARHTRDDALEDKHVLALELYSSARFEASERARFLTLVTVVEVLSSRGLRSDAALQLIASWSQALLDSALGQDEKNPLNSALNDLRSESIGAACRRLVRSVMGDDDARFFRDCYNARSDLLHDGSTNYPIREHLPRLQTIVSTILLRFGAA